jgi:flagellar biosynthesis chaperone FliJ
MTRGVTVRELRQQEKMLHMYEREAVVLEEAVSKARWMMQREEKAMQEAWRENRKLELMKEKEEAKHVEKIKRSERMAMDDTAVQMYLQKQTVQHYG